MKIRLSRTLEIEEINKKIRSLKRKKNVSNKEKNSLLEYERAFKEYEESGEVFYVEEYVTEMTLQRFRKMFTTKRMEILNQLNKRGFNSIAELSRFLKRDIKNVYDDLKIMEGFGLVKLKKQSKNSKVQLNVEGVGIEFFSG